LKTINLKLSDDLHKELKVFAASVDTDMTKLINQICRAYLAERKNKQEVRK